MKKTKNYYKIISLLLAVTFLFMSLAGCRKTPLEESVENDGTDLTPKPPEVTYVRTGETTDFVTSEIDLDELLARPYDAGVPTAFSEGVFALYSSGWGFDNDTLFTSEKDTGMGMPIRITVGGREVVADSAVWRPSHVSARYESVLSTQTPTAVNLAPSATIQASYTCVYDPKGLTHLTDGVISYGENPRNRWTNYVDPPRTGVETLTLDFDRDCVISGVTLHLFDDNGDTRLPARIQVAYETDGDFQIIPDQVCDPISPSTGINVTFSAVQTQRIRILLTPQSGKAVGVTELAVQGYQAGAGTIPQGLVIEEKKLITASDVAMSILTLENNGAATMEITVSATPSVGLSEKGVGGSYVLFGSTGLAKGKSTNQVRLGVGERVELRFAMSFSAEKGKNAEKLGAHLSDPACFSQHKKEFLAWFEENVPYFDCDDPEILQTYYFRWLVYRNHIRRVEDGWNGYVVTEFLPYVYWGGTYNTINCPVNHHLMDGRWIRDPKYLDAYQEFWSTDSAAPRAYSLAIADAYYNRYLVSGDREELVQYLTFLDQNYQAWEANLYDAKTGLFFQTCHRDGMEKSIGGDGYRPTINSYMYGDALAIAQIARMVDDVKMAKKYEKKAADLKERIVELLWNEEDGFFETVDMTSGESVGVRELVGYVPWYFHLPDDNALYAKSFAQLLEEQGFLAPYGPTTAEQRSSEFMKIIYNDDCRWDGPSWPYATSQTLVAAANLLNDYRGNDVFDKGDWFDLLQTYAKSQYKDGYSWIAENLHPITGEWIVDYPRSMNYNHSSYQDHVITGLCGIRPSDRDDELIVNPLVEEDDLSYFVMENVLYRGRNITVLYDKDGSRYGVGAGLKVFVDGYLMAEADTLCRLHVSLTTP